MESFKEVKDIKCPEYRAFLYLIAFNLFTLAEYEKEHYNNFFKEYEKNRPEKSYHIPFAVDITIEIILILFIPT